MTETAPPDRAALTRALGELGLPAPDRIAPVGRAWRHRQWRVGFPPGSGVVDLMLREPVYAAAGDTLSPELAALTALQGTGLPVARRCRRIEGLGRPALLTEVLPGIAGDRWIADHPEHGPAVARAVGDVMARLAEVRQPTFGTRAVGNRFVPTRATWAASWRARLAALSRRASQGGDLGAASRALDRAIADRLPALEGVLDFSVVHGDLQPGNLLFEVRDGALALTGVVDWEAAIAGDPLVDWALPLLVPDGTLGHVLAGYGAGRARAALAEPGALPRIELYFLTHLLERLAFAAGPHLADDGFKRASARALVARQLAAFLEAGGVGSRLDRALGATGAGAVEGIPRASLEEAVDHGLIDVLARGSVRDPAAAWTWIGAARAVELARVAPVARDAWLRAAIALIGRLPEGDVRPAEPIADRAAHRAGLVGRVLAASRGVAGGPGTALVLLATGLDLAGRTGDALSDEAWRGLEEALHAMVALGVGWRASAHVSDPVQLAHGVMALAALSVVEGEASAAGSSDLAAARRGFADQVGAAWRPPAEAADALPSSDLLDLLDAGPPGVGGAELPALTPAICGALARLDAAGGLPVPAVAIAVALGLGADPQAPIDA